MLITPPWRRGQAKPFPSLPRINWEHPLTKGLINYMYDAGGGFLVDLVSGFKAVQQNAGAPAAMSVVVTPWGAAWHHPANTSPNSICLVGPLPPLADHMAANPPYSFAAGFVKTAAVTSNDAYIYWMITNGSAQFGIQDDLGGNPTVSFGNSGSGFNFTKPVVQNTFTTLVGTCASSTLATGYHFNSKSGLVETGTTGTVTLDDVTGACPVFFEIFNGAYPSTSLPSSSIGNTFDGSVFYGAAWRGRLLSATEARNLHDDPYQFLTYPEDDMFAVGVGPLILLLGDRTLDFGLNELDTACDRIYICSSQPQVFSDVTTYAIGYYSFGAGNAFGSPSAASPTGRKLSSTSVATGTLVNAGTAKNWAAVDFANSRLLASGVLASPLTLTSGQQFSLTSFTIHMPST